MTQSDDPHATQAGFPGTFESEAIPGALPVDQNSPRKCPFGLYAEQLNGTPFATQRADNARVWLYRILPSVTHDEAAPLTHPRLTSDFSLAEPTPNILRWQALPIARNPAQDFVDGWFTICGGGDTSTGFAVHQFAANVSMQDRSLCNHDGELLLVPEIGSLDLRTELGYLRVHPGQIAVIPTGVGFAVELLDDFARGSILEVIGGRFRLPERGVVGPNFLADARHFRVPVAAFEERTCPGYRLTIKSGGRLYQAHRNHSPFDVVAWHGNHVPYRYDLSRFSPVGAIKHDHTDPSLFTVLTGSRDMRGTSLGDLVVFPERWDPTEHTFRPPFFHRNAAVEYNSVVHKQPFEQTDPNRGGSWLTPLFSAHGVSSDAVERALRMSDEEANSAQWISSDLLSFQFESSLPARVTEWALQAEHRDRDYRRVHRGLKKRFQPPA